MVSMGSWGASFTRVMFTLWLLTELVSQVLDLLTSRRVWSADSLARGFTHFHIHRDCRHASGRRRYHSDGDGQRFRTGPDQRSTSRDLLRAHHLSLRDERRSIFRRTGLEQVHGAARLCVSLPTPVSGLFLTGVQTDYHDVAFQPIRRHRPVDHIRLVQYRDSL